jgi:hypothetical protein
MDGISTNGAAYNIGIGADALGAALTSDGNIGVGQAALGALTTGERNLAIGFQALEDMTLGDDNIAIGYLALNGLTTDANAVQNIGIGNYVMDVADNTASTAKNVCIGHNSGTLLTGDDNTCVGDASGDTISSGINNTIIGSGADTSAATTQNATAIGYGTVTKGNSTVTLGNADVNDVYMAFDSGATVHCAGIQFPATQAASADANNLDDYEEGTWTPAFTLGSGTADSLTIQYAQYTKVGRQVYFTARIVVGAISSPSGVCKISGLPFTSASFGPLALTCTGLVDTDDYIPQGVVEAGQTYAYLRLFRDGDEANTMAAKLQVSSAFIINGMYNV